MTRLLFTAAFLLGALAVAWMGSNFLDNNTLGLTVIIVIGGVYGIGFIELIQYRLATGTLDRPLKAWHKSEQPELTSLAEWVQPVHPSLQNAVRLRIEGQRIGLPTPVLTPYLVGLLVMLGLLGTFVGMVDTLKGAVVALEGTTKLEAIRAGLAAPIGGLSLAFGTSVAGVAASAMLGLMSTLSRRERMLSSRELDNQINGPLKVFSLVHHRQETYKALQTQTESLPKVAEQLQGLVLKIEQLGDHLSTTLLTNQEKFHETATRTYTDLADSVGNALRESLAQSGQLAGESIRPVVQEAMLGIRNDITENAHATHQALADRVQSQLSAMQSEFSTASAHVSRSWQDAVASQTQSHETFLQTLRQSFSEINSQVEANSAQLVAKLDETTALWFTRLADAEQARLGRWIDALQTTQTETREDFKVAADEMTGSIRAVAQEQVQSISILTENMETLSASVCTQWQTVAGEAQEQQHALSQTVERSTQQFIEHAQTVSEANLSKLNVLLEQSDALLQARTASESAWFAEYQQRMEQITSNLNNELSQLAVLENKRSEAAVAQLAQLEDTVSQHLQRLGLALEQPMTRLIETASETPRAAAEVISELRNEVSKNIERDNSLLEERKRNLEELRSLSETLERASNGQLQAVEQLVDSTTGMFSDVGDQFQNLVQTEVTKMSDVAVEFTSSAVELSSLAEAFQTAVNLYNESNHQLIEQLNRMESALGQSTERSDEQLGYYVAQARDVIDHSILSQKEIFEELRQLSSKSPEVVD
ncbi:DUF802 domain-containing protein [Oleiphilus messinensis]|nr:DUF802 domain-containing protein [Oleiphilus messinensis]